MGNLKSQEGAISVEYILSLIMIAAVIILGISFLGIELNSLFQRVINILPF